jgi:DNA-binding beta-propeller fold protein YncE
MFRLLKWGRVAFAVLSAGAGTPVWGEIVGYAYVTTFGDSNNISAYSIEGTTGALTPVVGSPYSAGATPLSVAVTPAGQYVYVANYASNNVSAFSIDATGGLSPAGIFPAGLGPSGVTVDPTAQFVYVANRGSNNVSAYRIIEATGALDEHTSSPYPAGSQPVSVAVDPTSQFLYVTNLGSSDISAYSIDGIYGYLTEIDGSPFRQTSQEVDPRSVVVHPLGEYAYVANEGSVAGYRIDATTGALERLADSPYLTQRSQAASVALDPTGRFAFVASMHISVGGISAYTIGPATGTLIGVSGSPYYSPRSPISVAVDPTGQYAYVANSNGGGPGSVSGHRINQTTGQLTEFVTDPFPAPYGPSSIAITAGPPVDPLFAVRK